MRQSCLSAQGATQEHHTLIDSLQNQVSLQQQLLLAKAELARQDKCLMNALAPLGGRAGELFGAACGGYLHSLMKRVLSCVRVAVEMPFSSTLAAAAGATERLQGCTVARKIALLTFTVRGHVTGSCVPTTCFLLYVACLDIVGCLCSFDWCVVWGLSFGF